MVLLQLTPALRTRLDALAPRLPLELRDRVASHLAPHGDDEAIQNPIPTSNEPKQPLAIADRVDETIPHQVLVDVSSWARGADLTDRDDFRLASLLRLTDVHAPPPAPRGKSPELLAILSSIQLEQDRRSYASLTSLLPAPHPSLVPLNDPYDSSSLRGPPKSPAEEWRDIRRELSAIVNVGASVAAVATAVWWVSFGYSYLERILLSFLGALAIAAIEAFLYYRFFTRLAHDPKVAKAGAKSKAANTPQRGATPRPRLPASGSKGAKQQ
ncbi:endoplasmic reticulum-based factor for assembly of V-ATPase-domain-containing protein [Rhodotorula diobovata]|uniref:Endoplasmic reticulum-based factor for assembly of V-ATPase-domain-containing protein n=1 Tax=Rhodotorula diobovata TaxID=5288 RepID=A0A5C5FR50_9BASI|nr:endoplasmic reticulum-based factor for assembly of V-ATPase-domain-containing protein [Rhodotorula diobovata]